ncbi:DUF4344 domain-containing metallopeptidase [Streptomyces sp. NBC_01235]|uniref:DUF4344 domain-containing metallopeptidase n=1 Tax=Streptomyces sp. NBC_01235 TaxID=2903788 RepID=UPI002E1644A0|nr:DUF4344 domain-containing metallopeptidase [Streptomyces sp. NBC_01235]
MTLLVVCGTACQNTGASAPPDTQDAVVAARYEEPTRSDREAAAFLRERKLVEEAAAAVADLVTVDRAIPLVVLSCDGAGSSYDPEARRTEICYDEVSETRDLFQRAGRPRADDEVAAVLLETLFHETAHALIDALDLPVTGREEDFADQFAALMLLRKGAVGERQLRAAADAWRLFAATTEDADGNAEHEDDDEGEGEGEHSPDRERAVNEFCYVYGSAPGRHRDLVSPDALPAGRAKGCVGEWATVRGTWLTALGPALTREE